MDANAIFRPTVDYSKPAPQRMLGFFSSALQPLFAQNSAPQQQANGGGITNLFKGSSFQPVGQQQEPMGQRFGMAGAARGGPIFGLDTRSHGSGGRV